MPTELSATYKCAICDVVKHAKEHKITMIHIVPIAPKENIGMYRHFVHETYDNMRMYGSGVADYHHLCLEHSKLMKRRGFWMFPTTGAVSEPDRKDREKMEAKA